MEKDYSEDFLSWAEDCVKIVDKLSGASVPFVPNAPQRRVFDVMERQRRAGRPIRLIMLKARQWGGSTLIQVYMAWMQLVRHTGWNSVICAHVKDASAGIRGMYSRLLREYPDELKTGSSKGWTLTPYEKTQGVVEIAARDCRIALATAGAPNSVRSSNLAMAHLSEVAFWGDGEADAAEEIVRTVSGTVGRTADSLIVMESTANGKDNYFYREWKRAEAGESDKEPVFVPWYEIEMYSREITPDEREELFASFDEYERELIARGVSAESVAWYHDKRREYPTHTAMMAEFPSTPEEAFSTSASDTPFREEDLPELTDRAEEGLPLLVVLPAASLDRRAMETFVINDGIVTATGSLPLGNTVSEMLGEARKWGIDRDAIMCVAAPPDSADYGHAVWLAEKAIEKDVELFRSDDEEIVITLDNGCISRMIDLHHERMDEGRVRDTDPDAREDYLLFRYGAPQHTPRILARLVALTVADSLDVPIDCSDLLPIA